MATTPADSEDHAPCGMVEWGLLRAWRMREDDDEGIGGVKRECPHGGWSPFNWWFNRRRHG